jgi:hypothetical protein
MKATAVDAARKRVVNHDSKTTNAGTELEGSQELGREKKIVSLQPGDQLREEGMTRQLGFTRRSSLVSRSAGVEQLQRDSAVNPLTVLHPNRRPRSHSSARNSDGENAFSTFSLNVSDVSFKLAAASLEKA